MGFNVYRSDAPSGEQIQLNDTLILGRTPGSPTGARYDLVDTAVIPGITYYYWLEDVDAYGGATRHGPVSAEVALLRRLLPARPRLAPGPPLRSR